MELTVRVIIENPQGAPPHHDTLEVLRAILKTVIETKGIIMATSADLITRINALGVEIAKVGAETDTLIQLIADLRTQIQNGPVDPAVEAALAAVEAQAKVVDDKVPDVPPVVTP